MSDRKTEPVKFDAIMFLSSLVFAGAVIAYFDTPSFLKPAPAWVAMASEVEYLPRVERQPLQAEIATPFSEEVEGYTVTSVARFEVDGLVLGAMRYRADRMAGLAPVDLALAWGPMAEPGNAGQLEVWQSNRFYFWRFPPGASLTRQKVTRNSANMHMIPASEAIAQQIKEVRKGDLVSIRGRLVNIEAPDGWRWRTSLSRNDTGPGACEIILVEEVVVVRPDTPLLP